jgi:REP element-mobilizing transposase RayT
MERKFKGTPPRLPILFQREYDPLYFVTFNTLLRRPLLANESVHKAFRTYAERGLAFNVATGRYVLMPDHVHVFVRIGRDMKLSRWESGLKQCLGKALKLLGHEPTTLTECKPDGCSVEPVARISEEGFGHRPIATDERVEGALKSFWQPGFFDHLLRQNESYAEKWNYVWQNPVRAKLVSKPEDWPYQGEIHRIDRV